MTGLNFLQVPDDEPTRIVIGSPTRSPTVGLGLGASASLSLSEFDRTVGLVGRRSSVAAAAVLSPARRPRRPGPHSVAVAESVPLALAAAHWH